MSLKMSEFHGIDPKDIAKLSGAGIENTDDLMKIWADKEKRAGLAASTGIPEERFLKFAAMARLGRVKGMDLKHLDALVAAGIDGPKGLFRHTPETLAKHLGELAAEKKLTGSVPTLAEIGPWFADQKTNGSMESTAEPVVDPKPETIVAR